MQCKECKRESNKLIGGICIECMAVASYIKNKEENNIENMPIDREEPGNVNLQDIFSLMDKAKRMSLQYCESKEKDGGDKIHRDNAGSMVSRGSGYVENGIDTNSEDFKDICNKYNSSIQSGDIEVRLLSKFGENYTGNILDIQGDIAVVASDKYMDKLRANTVYREEMAIQKAMPERLYNIIMKLETNDGLSDTILDSLPEVEDFVEA